MELIFDVAKQQIAQVASVEDSPYECVSKVYYAGEDYPQKPMHISKILKEENVPEEVTTLINAGFYLQGSRSKMSAFPEAVEGADWDLTFPILDHEHFATENLKLITTMGFNLFDDGSRETYDGEATTGFRSDILFNAMYTHPTLPITVIRRKHEKLFRYCWDSIDPTAFEMFVWKRSFYNKAVPRWIVQDKRYVFMQNLYSVKLGLDNYSKVS